jgi:hypothetical protein
MMMRETGVSKQVLRLIAAQHEFFPGAPLVEPAKEDFASGSPRTGGVEDAASVASAPTAHT